jgi:hypothetical protein
MRFLDQCRPHEILMDSWRKQRYIAEKPTKKDLEKTTTKNDV